MRLIISVCALAISMTAAGAADAAAEITMEHTSLDDPKAPAKPETLYLSPDGAKIDMDRNMMIYRPADGAVIMVNKEKHSYMDLGAMAKKMAAAQAQMEASMKSMPEAQRKAMEGMMAKMGGGDMTEPVYTKTGSKTVNGWPCDVYHVSFGGSLQTEECIAKLGAVGLDEADLAVLRKLGETTRNALPAAFRNKTNPMDFDAMTKALGYEGVPVETTMLGDGGKPESRTTLKSVTHDPLPAGTFDVPAGYVKQSGLPVGE
jgi:hypothetical protein